MYKKKSLLMVCTGIKKDFNNTILQILCYHLKFSFTSSDVSYENNQLLLANPENSTMYNIYTNIEVPETCVSSNGLFEDLFDLNEIPPNTSTGMRGDDRENKGKAIISKHTLSSYYVDLNSLPLLLECPQDIFDDDSSLTYAVNRKRRLVPNNCNTIDGSITYSTQPRFDEQGVGPKTDNKKRKTHSNVEEYMPSEEYLYQDTRAPDFLLSINTKDQINEAFETGISGLIDTPENHSDIKDINKDPKGNDLLYVGLTNNEIITESDFFFQLQDVESETTSVVSSVPEFIQLYNNDIKSDLHLEKTGLSSELPLIFGNTDFLPHISDENYRIFPYISKNRNIKSIIKYRRKEETKVEYMDMEDSKIIKNGYCPEITVLSVLQERNCLKISCIVNNIPRYLVPTFSGIILSMKTDMRYISQQCVFLYQIFITYCIPNVSEIKLIDLIPNLKYATNENMWKENYIKLMLNWKYKVPKHTQVQGELNNEMCDDVNGAFKNVYVSKNIRSFMGIYNFRYKHYKEFQSLVDPIFIEMVNKLSLLHVHIVYLNSLNYSIEELPNTIKEISHMRIDFLSDKLQPENNVLLTDAEIEILAVYELLYKNFDQLSASIVDTYNIYMR